MKLYHSPFIKPEFNLAIEEYLFENFEEEFLMIYRNETSVIIGKHQNTLAEVNIPYVTENDIPFVRRFSGGGTVYHDLNNINFSFITTGKDTKVIDFKKYAQPVIQFLQSVGLNASLSDRNDILLNAQKISGHAAHAKNKRALHHGTLLFNADLEELSTCLRSNKDKFKSRAVQSVRSQVCNVSPELSEQMSVEDFADLMIVNLSKTFGINDAYTLSDKEIQIIETLVENKYKTWDWNVAYSPEYTFSIDEILNGEEIKVTFEVKKGHFTKVESAGNNQIESTLVTLLNCRHSYREIESKLTQELGERSKKVLNLLF